MSYKISGTNSDNSTVYILQDKEYIGYKDIDAGNYSVTFDSTTPSGITAVAEKNNGHVIGYGDVEAITTTGTVDITRRPLLNSIQQGEISIVGAGITSGTVTITEVDLDKSLLIFHGSRSCLESLLYHRARIELTNATTVTAFINTASVHTKYFDFTVLEFSSGIASIQSGTIAMTNEENTATIDEVDTDKSFVIHLGELAGIDDITRVGCTLELTNGTTVTCKNTQTNALSTVGFMVVEFD